MAGIIVAIPTYAPNSAPSAAATGAGGGAGAPPPGGGGGGGGGGDPPSSRASTGQRYSDELRVIIVYLARLGFSNSQIREILLHHFGATVSNAMVSNQRRNMHSVRFGK